MRHLDLFSGIGGFSLAARWAGIETIQFVEIDKFCQKVLSKHWPNVPIHGDIKTFHFTDKVDLLTAGFPCQPFSVAGKRKGIADDRYLWPDTFRIIRECHPDWIILENVPGIVPKIDSILNDLASEGYDFRAYLIPASTINAPHKRERLWIIAHLNGKRCDARFDFDKQRQLQDDFERHIEEIQSEWPQRISKSWKTHKIENWLSPKSEFIGNDDGVPNRVDRNKSLGNAIVPQIPFLFMKMILFVSR